MVFSSILMIASDSSAAVPETRSRRGLEFSISGGWARPQMTSINEAYIDGSSSPAGEITDHINGAMDLGAEGLRDLNGRTSVGLRLTYLHASTEGRSTFQIFDDEGGVLASYPLSHDLATRLVAAEVAGRFSIHSGVFRCYVVGGFGWGHGKAELSTRILVEPDAVPSSLSSETYKWTAGGVIGELGIRTAYGRGRSPSVGLEVGYRYARTDDLTDEDGRTWTIPQGASTEAVDVEFSGPYAHLFLSFSL